MKTKFFKAFSTIAMMGCILVGVASAQAEDAKPMQGHGAMGKMDMEQMHTMNGECMKMHKDGKMCDHTTMGKCEEHMSKDECQKMMTHMKTQSKTKTK